jgi:acyl dehydratase
MTLRQAPYFDELHVGQRFATAPAVTVTSGLAAAHQAITGDRLALALDAGLAAEVTGQGALAHPALVWDLAIGQSTLATQHVKANLFYRGLTLRRAPVLGDTLHTTTVVEGLRQNRPREGRAPTGLAALRITTTDQHDRPVLDFWRCAMLPLRDPAARTGHADDLDAVGVPAGPGAFGAVAAGWDLTAFRRRGLSPAFADLRIGPAEPVSGGDVVSGAPELARLTLNIAAVHHDARAAGGRRLVYGGHTIALALSQAARALPGLVTVTGWHGCDHLGPVHEGDTLRSTLEVEALDPLDGGAGLAHLRSRVSADGADVGDGGGTPVLDWRFVALFA